MEQGSAKRQKTSNESFSPEERGTDRNGNNQDTKAQKACLNCRRSKLKCEISTAGPPCKRCATRNAQCRFTGRAHDDEWQLSMEDKVAHLLQSVQELSHSVQYIVSHLNLPSVPGQSSDRSLALPTSTPLSRSGSRISTSQSQPMAFTMPSDDYYSTQQGASALLAQTFVEQTANAGPQNDRMPSNASNTTGSPGYQAMLDDLLGSPVQGHWTPKQGPDSRTVVEVPGSRDPRPNVVNKSVVDAKEADLLVDFFHQHLSCFLCGFPLQLGAWPYLPEGGKSYITPLILGAMCLVAAERLPEFHHLVQPLTTELRDVILEVKPPAPPIPGGEEPELDPELGIGVEEITALLIAATFVNSRNSTNVAQLAFHWTRNYLKNFMLPVPPPMTLGEAFGLLPAYRPLGFGNWLRMWLITYVVDVQQALHHSHHTQAFDPAPFCAMLLDLHTKETLSHHQQCQDQELAAHASLCSFLHRILHSVDSPEWKQKSAEETFAVLDEWDAELERWRAASVDEAMLGETQPSPRLILAVWYQYSKLYINQAALGVRGLSSRGRKLTMATAVSSHPGRWRFVQNATRAAQDLLMTVSRDKRLRSDLPMMPPYYIQVR